MLTSLDLPLPLENLSFGVEGHWPCRLLHIPTMTSLQRVDGNIYGQAKEPSYGIISYTWGRYEVSEGPRIQIHGIDWNVPSIDEDHFTVADLTRVLQHVGLNFDYVWIDIACIDQKRYKAKMEEIGRQAAIFKRARQGYVWLNTYEAEVIGRSIQRLLRYAWNLAQKKELSDIRITDDIINATSVILQDRWFSSLWTLQESFLKRMSVLLNKRGEPIETRGPWVGQTTSCCYMLELSVAFAMISKRINRALITEQRNSGEQLECSEQFCKLQDMCTVLDRSGVNFERGSNPNITYAAAQFRQTSRTEDRIYAIMQIFGYRLGDSARPRWRKARRFTFEELELQFLRALNTQSPVLSQAFQHLQIPRSGESWSITNAIRVPESLRDLYAHEYFVSSKWFVLNIQERNKACFKALGSSLTTVFDLFSWRAQAVIGKLEQRTEAPTTLRDRAAFLKKSTELQWGKQGFIFDKSNQHDFLVTSLEWPPNTSEYDEDMEPIIECRVSELKAAAQKIQELRSKIAEIYGEQTQMLYLGRVYHHMFTDLGLIVTKDNSSARGLMKRRDIWRRIGLCFWRQPNRKEPGFSTREMFPNPMEPMKGIFG